jgi:hypothetical protein
VAEGGGLRSGAAVSAVGAGGGAVRVADAPEAAGAGPAGVRRRAGGGDRGGVRAADAGRRGTARVGALPAKTAGGVLPLVATRFGVFSPQLMSSAHIASETLQRASAIVDWYWKLGVSRKGIHALSKGEWLRRAYEIAKRTEKLRAGAGTDRKAVALWGPSQSGKSTFLSHFIDKPHGECASALQWETSPSIEFQAKGEGTIALNPYNQQRDASGCITRFTLRDSPISLSHPVEVVLVTREQLLLSLALGYHSECRKHGLAVHWNSTSVRELLATFSDGGRPDRLGYELLHDVVGAIGHLIHTGIPRYQGLKPDWSALSAQILESDALSGNADNIRRFFSKIFWDGDEHHRLVGMVETLAKRLAKLRAMPFRQIAATYEAAAFLLDIDGAEKVNQDSSTKLSYWMHHDLLLLGGGDGTRFDQHGQDFAAFQALIGEIRVPLNRATLEATAPEVIETLSQVDFVDFPGVSRQDVGGHLPNIDEMSDLQLYTQVLKRGKTASVFLSYSENLAIDAVALLTRTNGGVFQPDQLIGGVSAWVRSMGHPWPPRESAPPLNIVMTFSARLINEVADAAARGQQPRTLDGVFSWFEKLGPVADPSWTRFWAVSYPKFTRDGGRIDRSPEEALVACDTLMKREQFRSRFGHRPNQLHEMAAASREASGDGGVLSFISSLSGQLSTSDLEARRADLVRDMRAELIEMLRALTPGDGAASSVVKAEFDSWKRGIETAMKADPDSAVPGATTARAVMDLLTVDPSDLDPLPPNASQKNIDAYVRAQIYEKWLPRISASAKLFAAAGITSTTSAVKRATLLAEFVSTFGGLARWIKNNLGDLTRPDECDVSRRFLAAHMSDLLTVGTTRPAHRTHAKDNSGNSPIQASLLAFAAEESRETGRPSVEKSPHYIGVIAPFFAHLDSISLALGSQREPQPGDAEAAALLSAMQTP